MRFAACLKAKPPGPAGREARTKPFASRRRGYRFPRTVAASRRRCSMDASVSRSSASVREVAHRTFGACCRRQANDCAARALHELGPCRGREGSTEAHQQPLADATQSRSQSEKQALQAEGEGFEPSKDLTTLNGFRDRPVQPLRHPSFK